MYKDQLECLPRSRLCIPTSGSLIDYVLDKAKVIPFFSNTLIDSNIEDPRENEDKNVLVDIFLLSDSLMKNDNIDSAR